MDAIQVSNFLTASETAALLGMSIPKLVAALAAILYYLDFLQSPQLSDSNNVEQFDFIVVGGGSAGCVVASRLSQLSAQYRVLLLEAGGTPNPLTRVPIFATAFQRQNGTDWQYQSVPQKNCCLAMEGQRSLWPRGKMLGGTSSLNFMLYQRGNPNDWQQNADATGDPQWSYEQLLPFFKRSEDYHGNYKNESSGYYHGQGGPLHVEAVKDVYLEDEFLVAAKELGYQEQDSNAHQGTGFSRVDATIKDGHRWSTYDAFIRPIEHLKNLVIYRYAQVIKIHLDRSKHAYGVSYVRHGQQKFVSATREIILSAGAVDSPKLLLLSGIGPASHLHSVGIPCRVHLPGVGTNLQDHISTVLGPILLNGKSVVNDRDLNFEAANTYLSKGEGPFASPMGVSGVGFIPSSLSNDSNWPDLALFMCALGISKSLVEGFTQVFGTKQGLLDTYFGPHVGSDANVFFVMLGKPLSRGYIQLASANPWDKPVIQPNYFSNPDDLSRLVEGVKFAVNLYDNTTTYQQRNARLAENPFPGCEQVPFKSDAYYECYIRHMTTSTYHYGGTCAMGKTEGDPEAVVDSQLRVRKVTGLRVADTSVLRYITNANLNAPAIVIGEKAAFFIAQYWAQHSMVSTPNSYYFQRNHHLNTFYRAARMH